MTSPTPVVVGIRNDPPWGGFLRTDRHTERIQVFEATTGRHGRVGVGSREPILRTVDRGLPDMKGVQVSRALRGRTMHPMITYRDEMPSSIRFKLSIPEPMTR